MGIFINNLNRREDYDQIAQLQNQINSYLANPNVDESTKSSARKQLEELSASVNTYGSRKEARKSAIQTLNSIASSLKPSEDNYTPQYVIPTTGIKASATFDPQLGEQKYNVAGLTPNLKQRVDEFSKFLIDQLTFADNELAAGKLLYNWTDSNTSKINEWISKLQTPATTEEDLKKRIDFMGNTIVNALANDNLTNAFASRFAPWLEGSDEYKAAQAAAAVEAQKAAKNPTDLAAYPTLTSNGYIFEKGSDGKYIAYQVKEGGTKGDEAGQTGYMNPDFTSSGYKSGWIIGPNGVVTLINDFSDVTTYRDYLQTEGWKEAIKNAKSALLEKYPKAFNFTNTFDQNPFGEGIALGNKNFIDLSYYFPGEGYVLGVQKDTDADNFEGYNWNEEDREFYVSKDGQNWEIVKGMAAVRTLLGLDEGNGFNYEGADILADAKKDKANRTQFNRAGYLEKPEDWDYIPTATPRKNWWKDYGFADESSFIRDLVKFTLPGNYEKAALEFGIQKSSWLKKFVDKNIKTHKEEGFYKWLFLKAQSIGLSKDLLAGILMRYNFGKEMPLTIKEKEAKAMVAEAKGEVGEDPIESHAKGGILKFENGGSWYLEYANVRPDKSQSSNSPIEEGSESLAMTELTDRADASGRSIAGLAKGEGNFKLDGPMWLRTAALTADIAGLIASFAPGGGTVAAGVTGAASVGLDLTADILDESVSNTDKALNAASNLFFGVLGMIPGGKVWKVTKSLGALGGSLYSLGIITPDIYNKVKAGESLTYDDWKSVYAGLSILVNSSTMARSTYNLHKMKKLGALTKTGTNTHKSGEQEFKLTDADLKTVDEVGRKEGQAKAVEKVKEILKLKSEYSEEDINNATFGFEYRDGSDNRNFWHLRAGRPKTSIFETFTPEYTGPSNPFSDFYRNDPYRRGNPYNPNAMRTSKRKRWTISDYALVNNPDADLFSSNLLKALKLGKLKDWAHIVSDALVKGESYDTRNNKRAAVTANGLEEVRRIPKDNELIVVNDGNTDIVVELEPVKGKPGEYVNYQNKKEVYTKTTDGKFEKKTVNLPTEPNKSQADLVTETNNSKLHTQEDIDELNSLMNRESTPKTGIEYTTTEASHQTYSQYVSLARQARNKGKKLLNKDEVNELLSKMTTVTNQEYKPAQTGGFVVNGKLTYNRAGGKLNRLNNYLNNK